MVAVVLSIQSLNYICMTSIWKCSIDVTRWFFFRPRSVNFRCRCRLGFFRSVSVNKFFFHGGQKFSLPSKWKHAGVGRNTTLVELKRKNLAVYIVNFYGNTEQNSILYRKKILRPTFVKKPAQCRLEDSSRGYFTTYVGCCFVYSIPE